ncbi:sensor histidine kinase [Candidatus Electronema sp. PJ]|uniref:sensor histidine kinase n=1 Tax=Candidatus Electronema sp. PJ TaxID=3401572 RepID=UPI003AA7CD2F
MHSYFASPERTDEETLAAEIDFAGRNPVICGLLSSVGGMLAVLDEHRQLVALNDEFLQMLGVDHPAHVLGLRPGEALHCLHAHKEPGGCGTSKYCSTCGAAIAIVSSLKQDEPEERLCAFSALKDGKTVDAALLVKSRPIHMEEKRFLLLFVQDVTRQQQRAALERTFFHDMNSMLGLLAGAAELMVQDEHTQLAEMVQRTSMRLAKEVAVHRYLIEQSTAALPELTLKEVSAQEILEELRSFFASYTVAYQKEMYFPEQAPATSIRTDLSLLLRVVCNMITNALEACCTDADPNAGVKVWLEQENGELVFRVWNAQVIPTDTARRIFQLHFSTKGGEGRGIGAYSMKLLGEKLLGGAVSFTSSTQEGTVFRFALPLGTV